MLTDEQKAYWHPTKNAHLDPETLGSKSHALAWWVGECRHEWDNKISISSPPACPYCANKRVLEGFNDLLSQFPKVALEWSDKNEIQPNTVYAFSTKKAWWECRESHSWETYIRNRTKDLSQCPYCTNYKVWPGFNDLKTKYPEVAKEWHPSKNKLILITEMGAHSHQKVWWLGKCGHEWKALVYHRTLSKSGCPECKVNPSLLKDHTTLAREIHPTKNESINFEDFREYSNEKIWWLNPECGHEWEATPYSRIAKGCGCSTCAGKVVISGFNDLESQYPDLASEWDYYKNDMSPTEVTSRTSKSAWWICKEKQHSWKQAIAQRTKKDGTTSRECPFCSGHRFLPGFNDAATKNPNLIKEWHPSKNSDSLNEIAFNSWENRWWQCEKGHEWEARTVHRVKGKSNCPDCIDLRMISSSEKEIKDWIESLNFEVIQTSRKLLKGQEIDLYIPKLKLGIEFNGVFWHSLKKKRPHYHENKFKLAREQGILLLQIWEHDYLNNPELIRNKILSYLQPGTDNEISLQREASKIRILDKNTEHLIAELSLVEKDSWKISHWNGEISIDSLLSKIEEAIKDKNKSYQDVNFIYVDNDYPSIKATGSIFLPSESEIAVITARSLEFDIQRSGYSYYKLS